MAEHTLFPSIQPDDAGPFGGEDEDDDEICGTEKSDGTICERDPEECPYHG